LEPEARAVEISRLLSLEAADMQYRGWLSDRFEARRVELDEDAL
jgi:hypothetical protein